MQIFITGGTGLIGRHLIERLYEQHTVTVLTRNIDQARKHLPPGITFIEDLGRLSNLDAYDAVINLAGEPIADKRWTEQQKNKICESRWQITTQLVEKITASEHPPATFISGSAIGYYGRQGDKLVDEDTPPHPEFTHEVCKKWETIAMTANGRSRVCTLRTGVVLASSGGALSKMRLPFKLALGGKIGSGEQYMSWIHIEDMVAGILYLMAHPECSGPYNLTAPNSVTNKEFVTTFAKALGRPSIFPMPAAVLKLLMGEAADMLLTGQRVIPQRLTKSGFVFKFPTLSGALADTE